jgi:membrane-bound serine protease (ClpP class)
VSFITENLNLNSEQAKEINIIEFISPSIEDLLNQTNGLTVNATTQKTLDTENVEIVEYQPSLKIRFLSFITNPLLASLFLIIGIYALVFGLSSPGFGSEIAGVILIGLGLLGLGFSINLIAILLLVFGAVLVIIELYTSGFGVLGVAGIIAMIIGSIILIPTSFPTYFISEEFQRTMRIAVVLPSIVFGGFLAFALIKVVKIKRKKPVIGEIIGEEAKVTNKITSKHFGYVMYKGEIWRAKSNQSLKVGERVIITDKRGPILTVKRIY